MVSWPASQALSLSIVLIGWAAVMRLMTGSWLHPAALFPLWWCFAGILPLLLVPDQFVGPAAMAWVIVATLAVSLGAIVGNGGLKTRRLATPPPPSRLEVQILSTVLLISTILGMGSNVVFALKSGVSASDVIHLDRLVAISSQLYAARFVETGLPPVPPLASQALLPFVYLAPIIGGLVYVWRRSITWKLLALTTLAPAVAVTVLQTTKAAILFAGSLWLSSYFAARLRVGEVRVFTFRHFLVAFVLGSVSVVFFFAVGLARMASTDLSLGNVVAGKLLTSAFGHMSVFSQWLDQYLNEPFAPTLGQYTFSGPLDLMGFQRRVPGIFENVVELVLGETSNVYTGFRPLIEDFTMPGALAVLGILGAVAGAGYRRVAAGHWGAAPLLIAGYITIMWTPITWFWIYNSLTATVLALGCLVLIIRVWRGRVSTPHHQPVFVSDTSASSQ